MRVQKYYTVRYLKSDKPNKVYKASARASSPERAAVAVVEARSSWCQGSGSIAHVIRVSDTTDTLTFLS